MSQLALFRTYEFKEQPSDRVLRLIEGSRIAVVRATGDRAWSQQRWECQRCGRGGMWLSGPHWPDERAVTYALTKHKCRPVEADRILVDCAP